MIKGMLWHGDASSERRRFDVGEQSYDAGRLSWTPLAFQDRKHPTLPSPRYLHSAAAYQGRLYVLGGVMDDRQLKESQMYVLELATLKWTIVEGNAFVESRNGQACTLFKSEFYFFGGSQSQNHPTNTFFKYNPPKNTWNLISVEEPVPSERELALFTAVRDSFILLYGGIDLIEDKIYSDGYIYNNSRWHKLHITNNPSERIKMGVAVCGRRLFSFGGEGPSETLPLLFDSLHEIDVSEVSLEMRFREIAGKGKTPSKRTAHGMLGISQRLFLVYGGEGLSAQDNGGKPVALGDIWIFDTHELAWSEVQTMEGSMKPRYEFSLTLSGNQLYVFGGFNEQNMVIDDLAKLQFLPFKSEGAEVCSRCEQEEDKPTEKKMQLSGGFLSNLAMEITFPLRAIEMIVDYAEMLNANSINLCFHKNIEDFDYLTFQFDASHQISDRYFLDITECQQDLEQATLIHSLKLACLRLGKTILYVAVNDNYRKVFLISVDGKFAPNFEDHFTHFSYIQEISTGRILPESNSSSKQIIYNILKSQITDPYAVLSRSEAHILFIFQVNIIPTVQKAYYYELICFSKPDHDVKVYYNEKKNELLQSFGHSIASNPQFSLKNYLTISKLQRKIKVFIDSCEECIHPLRYLSVLDSYCEEGKIEKVALNLEHKLVQKCVIFKCANDSVIQYNQGILIYCGNQLIDRYKCPFGQLISTKFYNKKYKKSYAGRNIFEVVGIIYLSEELPLNRIKTRVKDRRKYNEILEQLTIKLKRKKQNLDKVEGDLSSLWQSRFSLSKQGSKRYKRDAYH